MKARADEPKTPDSKPAQDEVAKEAHAIYVKDGRPQGHAEQNGLEAEAHLQHAGSDHPEHHDHQDHQGHHAHMAADFRKRFWISLALTLPILVLSPLLQKLVGLREAIRFSGDLYVLFGLASAVFWYGGWPFLTGLFKELKSRQPGMMTLVAVAIATAYLYSSAVVFGLTGKTFFWELAMTGDGVNDAPALAQADVGIAICAGSDVAVETADVILVRSNPLDVVAIVQLSRATYRKMIQNLVWATGYNVVAIPLAAGALYAWGVVLTPAVGAVLMAASTVIVAVNARMLKLT